MIKILYVVSTLQRTGPTNQLSYIVKYLDRSRFEPHVLTLSPEPASSLIESFRSNHVAVHQLGHSRVAGLLLNRRGTEALVERVRPAIIHSQGARPDKLVATLRVGIPSLCTIRNYPQIDYPMSYGRIRGMALYRMHVGALPKLDMCCAVSDAVRENLVAISETTNVETLHNGVDLETYKQTTPTRRQRARDRIGLAQKGQIWVTTLGKDARKDTVTVVRAFLRISAQYPGNTLVVLGDGKLRSECEQISSDTDKVVYTGRVNDVSIYLTAADFFISASKAEGLPNAVLEAMAVGLPVLLSDIPPHVEIQRLNPDGAFSFHSGSLEDLCRRMAEMISRPWDKMAVESRKAAETHFSACAMSERYQSLYSRFVEGGTTDDAK